MSHVVIPDISPRISYAVGGTPQTSFAVPFPFFNASQDFLVLVGGQPATYTVAPTTTLQFSVAGVPVDAGFSGGTITLGEAVSNTTVIIQRDVPIDRTEDFPSGPTLNIPALNTSLDRIAAWAQQLRTKVSRALRLADDDTTTELLLPSVASRAGRVLGFDGTGTSMQTFSLPNIAGLGQVLPDGAGAVPQSADLLIREFIDVDIGNFGAAPGAPAATNLTAVNAAIARANAIGGIITTRKPGTYGMGGALAAITSAAGIDMTGAIFRDDAALTVPFMTLGASGTRYTHKVLRGVHLVRATQSPWTHANCVGLRLHNQQNITGGTVPRVRGFTVGVQGFADDFDFAYNSLAFGDLSNNQIALDMYCNGALNGVNQNRFDGGSITCDTGVNVGLDRYGWAFRRAAGGYLNHNSNSWRDPSFQHSRPGAGIAYCVLNQVNPTQNEIEGGTRGEELPSSTLRSYRNEGGGGGNRISFAFTDDYAMESLDATGASKFSWDVEFERYSEFANDALRPLLMVSNLRATLFADGANQGFDDLHVALTSDPGALSTLGTACLRSSSGLTATAEGVTVGASRGIGAALDTSELKEFCALVTMAAGATSGGRWQIRCYDAPAAGGVIIEDGGGVPLVQIDHPSFTLAWNATSRAYWLSADMSLAGAATRLSFKVAASVKAVQIALVRGSADFTAAALGIYTNKPIAARCWHGVTGGTRELVGAATGIDLPSLTDGATDATRTVTVTGAAVGDHAEVAFSLAGIGGNDAYVSAANTVTWRARNLSGAVLDAAAGAVATARVLKRRVP
jgi:hypothetical protein